MVKLRAESGKNIDESPTDLDDFSALRDYGCITAAQCAQIAALMLLPKEVENPIYVETANHYMDLVSLEITHNRLIAKHPRTHILYSDYKGMVAAGMLGTYRPIFQSDWLIPLEEARRWLQSKGIDFNFDNLRADTDSTRHGFPAALAQTVTTVPAPASAGHGWQSQARIIADECFDRDTRLGCRDTLKGYSYRVMEEMQKRDVKGSRGIIDNPNTVMREALQGEKWWGKKQK